MSDDPIHPPARRALLHRIGPGLLVAATGVGAGDLATSAFSGASLGTVVLWAVVVGAVFKFVLTEGIARLQLATGETLLESVLGRAPRALRPLFAVYLVPWSWFTGLALASACGVTAQALVPLPLDADTAKVVWGVAHSLVGLVLVWRGGFALFERMMGVAVAIMFVTVVATAVALAPPLGDVTRGLFVPSIPDAGGEGLAWTVALIGGVGGTLTILCYGYWIREEGRTGEDAVGVCRVDLAVGYAATAAFGLAMVVIGSTLDGEGRSAELVVDLADRLEGELGGFARGAFLVGAWAAVFSSLVGVWQGVPLVFADFWRLTAGRDDDGARRTDLEARRSYRAWLLFLAFVPLAGLGLDFRAVQQAYAVVGAGFVPLLALALLWLGASRARAGRGRTGPLGTAALLVTLAFFAFVLWRKVAPLLTGG